MKRNKFLLKTGRILARGNICTNKLERDEREFKCAKANNEKQKNKKTKKQKNKKTKKQKNKKTKKQKNKKTKRYTLWINHTCTNFLPINNLTPSL